MSPDTGDKQLARVKGVVGYQTSATSDFKPIFGRLDLPDDAYAVTKPNASAILRLADSSEIDIGENTKVQVGAFSPAQSGNANTIVLDGGALHFNVRHPQGGQSNYRFVTATSQIAVRGTEGFLIAGANGTQVVCVSCAAGDVSVQVGQQTISIVSNQTLTVLGSNPLTATTSITANPTVNNPAVNQFNSNQNPFNPSPTGGGVDPTGSLSGAGTGAAGAGAGTVVTTVGAAGATAGVVAAVTKSGTASPAPSGPGTLVLSLNFPGATAFPYAFSWPFSQLNATGTATWTCSPANIITCSVTQNLTSGDNTAATNATSTLNGILTGQLLAPGTFTIAGSASGYTLPATQFNVYSALSLTSGPSPLVFGGSGPVGVPGTQSVTVTQLPAGTNISAAISCIGGASASLTPGSGPSPLTLHVTANTAPATPQAGAACTLTVNGAGDGPLNAITIPVDITSTSIGISTNRRRPL